MRYGILATGLVAAGFFIWSIYAFAVQSGQFKKAVFAFLATAVIFFILIIIRKIRDDREYRRKTRGM